MLVLLLFAFLAGIVTILSPCILPILPIVLSTSLTGGRRRPFGIIVGFILSFTFFTLFLATIVKATGLPPDALRTAAIVVTAGFALTLLVPGLQTRMERMFSRLATIAPTGPHEDGFASGIVIGLSLGLLWAPCVGPILASVIALALTGTITTTAVAITFAYAAGTALPMLAITYGGRELLNRMPGLLTRTAAIQKTFGVLMLVTAIALALNLDRKFQTYILTIFPNYGVGLTKLEDNPLVSTALKLLNAKPNEQNRGKPMNEVLMENLGGAPELIGGQKWFNLPPGKKTLTLQQLRGNVVLIDFWTYTCINCIRTLPYTKAWYGKYKDMGFVLIGVHTPEFEFEKSADNVQQAIKDFGITYPVVQDNNYAIWNAYDNHYWPAHYLLDKNGVIRDTHFGEGAYDETEQKIQELLRETGKTVNVAIDNPTYEVQTKTPETYLGNARGDYSRITTSGTWIKSDDYASPAKGSSLTFLYNAANVYLVMRPKTEGVSGNVEVYLDGTLVKTVRVDSDKLYTLITLPNPGNHTLLLKFLDANLELYAFTFG